MISKAFYNYMIRFLKIWKYFEKFNIFQKPNHIVIKCFRNHETFVGNIFSYVPLFPRYLSKRKNRKNFLGKYCTSKNEL